MQEATFGWVLENKTNKAGKGLEWEEILSAIILSCR